jgi:glutathione S-transferase
MAHGSIVMFEGGAICSYLLDQFDTDRILLPKIPLFVSSYYLMVSWCASTIDNLTATSSPIRIVQDHNNAPRPMDDLEINHKYFKDIFAPYMSSMIVKNGGPFVCGEKFSAADVIVGFSILIAAEKMQPAWVTADSFPVLHGYYEVIRARPALQLAIGPCENAITTNLDAASTK